MSITKSLLSVCFLSLTLNAQEKSQLRVYGLDYNNERLLHMNNGFYVIKKQDNAYNFTKVQNCFIDPELRSVSSDKLQKFENHGYLMAQKLSSGEYALRAHVLANGGGRGGAWVGFWIGKIGIHLVAQGAYTAVAFGANIVLPGSGPAVYSALNAACTPTVEVTSNTIGIATGIVGAVTTGPV